MTYFTPNFFQYSSFTDEKDSDILHQEKKVFLEFL